MGKYAFVIITPGRSGSDHLSETLNNYPDIEMDGEIFNRSRHGPATFNLFLKSLLLYRIISYFFNREKISIFRFNFPLNFLISGFLNKKAFSLPLKGFKLTLDQLHAYPFLLKYILKNNIKIIYLGRKDRLAMALSHVHARDTGKYYTRTTRNSSHLYFFDTIEVVKLYQQIKSWEAGLFTKLLPETYYKVNYEELWNCYEQILAEIRAFLGLANPLTPKFSSLKKGNPEKLEDWVENLEAIKAALAL